MSIHVCVSQNRVVKAMFLSEALKVFFNSKLAARVWTDRYRVKVDTCANSVRHFTIDGPTRAGENDSSSDS